MIFGLAKAALPAAYILAASVCEAPPPPTVHMDFVNVAPVRRTDLSSAQLGGYHIDTTFSRSRNEIYTVGGLHLSELSADIYANYGIMTDPMTQMSCLSLNSVNIQVKYTPTIFVASNYKEGSCRYNTTLQHEARHVNTDIITFNELLPQMRQAVQDEAAKIGALGPMPPGDTIAGRDKIIDRLHAALTAKADELKHIVFDRQQMIDTRQEYQRLDALCADEPLSPPPAATPTLVPPR